MRRNSKSRAKLALLKCEANAVDYYVKDLVCPACKEKTSSLVDAPYETSLSGMKVPNKICVECKRFLCIATSYGIG